MTNGYTARGGMQGLIDVYRRWRPPLHRYRLPPGVAARRRRPGEPARPLYVLGLGRTHCATACLLRDGEVVACASEERFNRIKNAEVFPTQAVWYVLREAGITLADVDLAVYPYALPDVLTRYRGVNDGSTAWSPVAAIANRLSYRIPALESPLQWAYYHIFHGVAPELLHAQHPTMYEEPWREIGLEADRITAADHHTCHGFAAYYGFAYEHAGPSLVLTHDAEGDGLSAVVALADGADYRRLADSPSRHSLATLYGQVTEYMGMKRNEHEYKIMGLAPYASEYEINRVLPQLEELIWVEDDTLEFNSKIGSGAFPLYLQEHLAGARFDGTAGALQRLTERLMVRWATDAVAKTGVPRLALGGGLFMNVKGNKALVEIPGVDDVIPCPSAGDESTAIGAAFWGYRELCRAWGIPFAPRTIPDLYLGPAYSEQDIEGALAAVDGLTVTRPADITGEVATLLARGCIVARFAGRMEWGARALGNRSILANPSHAGVVRVLNEQVKNRDFWMPFAATVLKEREQDYLVNPKGIRAPFMAIAMDTTPLGRDHLRAAIHPYDYTCRPQVLEQAHNPSYHALLKRFEALTGIGAVLNTSFNLHGEPIVCTPADALSVFVRSGLEYLALGPYLVTKPGASTA